MKTFKREDLEFYLPDNFKSLTKEYIIEKVFDDNIQKNWNPSMGDVIVGQTGNIFVISECQHLHESLGGNLYFFGGTLCTGGSGLFLTKVTCYTMNKSGVIHDDIKSISHNKISDFRYVPYPHELNK